MNIEHFVKQIAVDFGLGEVFSFSTMRGSANRLWKFHTSGGDFVVKEFPYDNIESISERGEAARFEANLIQNRFVVAPEPICDQDGEYISIRTSSRGSPCAVRVHRWFEGQPPLVDDQAVVVQAGCSLRAIQEAGRSWSVSPTGSFLQENSDVLAVLDRYSISNSLNNIELGNAKGAIDNALELIHDGESLAGGWVYTHCDHKPENCLSQGGTIAVLDWDECGHCHPRLEAVEAALRWAGGAQPIRVRFMAFMIGYNASGQPIEQLHELDFAKWFAALVSWFSFQGRRSLGDWPQVTELEKASAAEMARDTLLSLQSSLDALPNWTRLI